MHNISSFDTPFPSSLFQNHLHTGSDIGFPFLREPQSYVLPASQPTCRADAFDCSRGVDCPTRRLCLPSRAGCVCIVPMLQVLDSRTSASSQAVTVSPNIPACAVVQLTETVGESPPRPTAACNRNHTAAAAATTNCRMSRNSPLQRTEPSGRTCTTGQLYLRNLQTLSFESTSTKCIDDHMGRHAEHLQVTSLTSTQSSDKLAHEADQRSLLLQGP
jgi:hypothetical protein